MYQFLDSHKCSVGAQMLSMCFQSSDLVTRSICVYFHLTLEPSQTFLLHQDYSLFSETHLEQRVIVMIRSIAEARA